MSKKILLCIRCRYGAYINLPMDEAAVLSFVRGWADGNLPLTKAGMVCGKALPEVELWAIKADEIVLAHTQEIPVGQMQGQTPPPWTGPRGSGV